MHMPVNARGVFKILLSAGDPWVGHQRQRLAWL